MCTLIDDPIVERLGDDRYVVRDDRVLGGTKRCFLDGLMFSGGEFVYASPACGGAQVAIACSARAVGAKATIFVAKRRTLHEKTMQAYRAGAKVVQVDNGYLANVQAKAKAYSEKYDAVLLPFGLDSELAVRSIAARAKVVAERIPSINQVWCAGGSGVLYRGLSRGFDCEICVVAVGKKLKSGDSRVTMYRSPLRFDQDAKVLPPFASCTNYDAKVWEFFVEYAKGVSVFWNVMA